MFNFVTLLLAVAAAALLVKDCSATRQEITFYTEVNQGGNGIIFRYAESDLSIYTEILKNAKSYCAVGTWNQFELVEFRGENSRFGRGEDGETLVCGNSDTIARAKSLRPFFNSDTNTPGISIYEGISGLGSGGRLFQVKSVAGAYIPFDAFYYSSTGSTSWTMFEGPNFEGNSACLPASSSRNVNYGWVRINNDVIPHSVVKGCGWEAEENMRLFRQRREASRRGENGAAQRQNY